MPSPVARQIQARRSTRGSPARHRQSTVGRLYGLVCAALGGADLAELGPGPTDGLRIGGGRRVGGGAA